MMERRSGLWIVSAQGRPWMSQRWQVTTRRTKPGLYFDGTMDQLWEGFGGGIDEAGWRALLLLSAVDRERALRALFDPDEGLRLNLVRIPVGASDLDVDGRGGSYNDSDGDLTMKGFSIERDVSFLIPFIRSAIRYVPRIKVLAVPFSPPSWMKRPARVTGGQISWKPEILDAYALYLARFVEEYRRIGIPIHQVHIQNRASSGHGGISCAWTGAQLREFIRNHAGPCFTRRRLEVDLWMGMVDTEDYLGYTAPVLTDALAREFMAGVSYQHVGSDVLGKIHKVWPGIRLMQSNCEGGGNGHGWDRASHLYSVMQGAMASGASAVLHGRLVSMEGGGGLIEVDAASRRYRLTPCYQVMRHLSCCILRNAVRLGLGGDCAGNAVAFVNEDDTSVLVIRNPHRAMRRLVVKDEDRLLVFMMQPESFNTIVL